MEPMPPHSHADVSNIPAMTSIESVRESQQRREDSHLFLFRGLQRSEVRVIR